MNRHIKTLPMLFGACLSLGVMGVGSTIGAGTASAVCHGAGVPFNISSLTMAEIPSAGTCDNSGNYTAKLQSKKTGQCVQGQYNVNGAALTILVCDKATSAPYTFSDGDKNSPFAYCDSTGCFGTYTNNGF